MVGKTRKVPYEDVLTGLVEHKDEIIVVEPSKQIWVTIWENSEKTSTPKAIYTDALRWYAVKETKVTKQMIFRIYKPK